MTDIESPTTSEGQFDISSLCSGSGVANARNQVISNTSSQLYDLSNISDFQGKFVRGPDYTNLNLRAGIWSTTDGSLIHTFWLIPYNDLPTTGGIQWTSETTSNYSGPTSTGIMLGFLLEPTDGLTSTTPYVYFGYGSGTDWDDPNGGYQKCYDDSIRLDNNMGFKLSYSATPPPTPSSGTVMPPPIAHVRL